MINFKKIPAAVYEDNTFQLFQIYGGAENGWISTIRSYGEWSCLPVSENYDPDLQEDINLILYYSSSPNQLHEINLLCLLLRLRRRIHFRVNFLLLPKENHLTILHNSVYKSFELLYRKKLTINFRRFEQIVRRFINDPVYESYRFASKQPIMKKIYFSLLAGFLVTVFAFVTSKETLVGTWKINYPSGSQVTIIFRDNGTIRAEIPSENFTVEGKYKMKGDILYVTDTTCGTGYWGKYKSKFFTSDSVYSEAIEDSCSGRRVTVDKQTLVRVKN